MRSMANPLAWIGSVSVLVTSYVRTMRRLREREVAQENEMQVRPASSLNDK